MRFIFGALLFGFTVPAYADSVNVQLFKSPFNLNYGMVESAIHDNAPWDEEPYQPNYFLSGDYHYVKNPLVVVDTTTNTRVRSLVNSVHTLDLGLGYFFSPGVSVYGQLPLNYSSLPGGTSQFDLADSRLAAKFALGDTAAPLTFALMPELVLPTGNKNRYLSDDGVGTGLLLVAENDFGSFRMAANLGYRRSGRALSSGIDYRNRIPIGLGAAIPISRQWLLNLEGSGALAIPTAQRQNASEFYAGLNYNPAKKLAVLMGGSLGAFDKAGATDYRLQAAVRMYFDQGKRRAQPTKVNLDEEPAPPPPPKPAPKPAPKARMVEDKIEILEEIQFDHNKDTLKARSKRVLDEVADLIREHEASIRFIEVEGHTSLVGTAPYNMKLSWRRARAVVAYLVHDQKIPAKLLVPKGYGKTRPKYIPGKATKAELELNRRVEFQVIRKKSPAR